MSQDEGSSANSNVKPLTRSVACKLRISHILHSMIIKDEETGLVRIELAGIQASRVNVVGTVIRIADDKREVVIDDGTGELLVRVFEEHPSLAKAQIGKCYVVVGKPREFSNEKYLILEIMKQVDPGWLKVRELELQELTKEMENRKTVPKEVVTPRQELVEEVVDEKPKPSNASVYDYIKEQDKGPGVDISEVIEKQVGTEEQVNQLLKNGDIFEVKPGRVKVLE